MLFLRRINPKKVSTVDKSNEKETISSNDEKKANVPQQIEAKKDAKFNGRLKFEGILHFFTII